uniref:metallophosphoesterase family protein n=1 Tax=Promineifilum sp. TaxID=2664178 RepID=UPI0035AEA57D
RAWGERMMRLSRAGIPTLLLIGNHDIAPAEHRAHTLQEFATLAVPHIHVADKLHLWRPEELGAPVQVLALPWVTRSRFLARHDMSGKTHEDVHDAILERIYDGLETALTRDVDPSLPLILTAHASVQGASYGSERLVMLGQELVLQRGLVCDPRFDYVALGHIHKHQSLNEQPPVVYPGSIERIDFGEAHESKGYVLAEIERGRATWRFVPLETRPFIDHPIRLDGADGFMDIIMKQLPSAERIAGAICRLRLEYPYEQEALLDERAIRERFEGAFDLRLVKHRTGDKRVRLPEGIAVESLSPYELLILHWQTANKSEAEVEALGQLAQEVLGFQAGTKG